VLAPLDLSRALGTNKSGALTEGWESAIGDEAEKAELLPVPGLLVVPEASKGL
jgi:hypothetical protein